MRHRFGRWARGMILVMAWGWALSSEAQVAGDIAVYPETSSIEVGSSRQYSAYVPISPNTVTWSVNDIVGGNATVGTISGSGLYQAPTTAPAANLVTIRARSTAFPTSVGSAMLTITRRYPWLWSVSPSPLTTGTYTVRLNGANFAPDSKALANGVELPTTYVSSTRLDATGVAATAGTLRFAVRQPASGAVTGNVVSVTVNTASTTVSISPSSASVALGSTRTFSATVSGPSNKTVTWSVNGIAGGSTTVGTISSAGLYTAPSTLPGGSTVAVRATSVATPTAYAQATVTLTVPPPPPVTVAVSPATATVPLGATQAFAAAVSGTNNTGVLWSVNGTVGGSSTVGTITESGIYTAPSALPSSVTVTVRAVSVVSATSSGQSTVTLITPPVPPMIPAQLTAARFLEQSSFGPSPASLARVAQMGVEASLEEQFSLPETPIPLPAGNSAGALRQWALYHYSTAPDQLRQRVAYSLSQIVVTSGTKLVYADEIVPWLRLLSQHAFGNYRDLLRDVTKCPSMGKFLDLANSMKPGLGGGANENYPRELLQLFTIGLWMLNPDGSQQTNAAGQPIASYDQESVRQVALALTGWTYATAPNATPQNANWEYFGAPMETRQGNHDTSSKTFLGTTLPAGQTVEQDLEGVLDCVMNHPNIAPFIATRLIRSLVMSNPSGGYIQRVASVFADNGSGVRGDLKAVVRAILLDPEARQDTSTVNQGRLKEPILHICGFLRALNGGFTSSQQVTYLFDYMAQGVLTPPSVFSWFSPLYRVPRSTLFGPEFQIYTPTEATLRGNFFHAILNYPGADFVVDLSPFQPYGNDMASLVEKANQVLLYGRMPAEMKPVIINAAAPGYDARTRIETVLYLTALSGQYAVQH